jgi:hypothetical protein
MRRMKPCDHVDGMNAIRFQHVAASLSVNPRSWASITRFNRPPKHTCGNVQGRVAHDQREPRRCWFKAKSERPGMPLRSSLCIHLSAVRLAYYGGQYNATFITSSRVSSSIRPRDPAEEARAQIQPCPKVSPHAYASRELAKGSAPLLRPVLPGQLAS